MGEKETTIEELVRKIVREELAAVGLSLLPCVNGCFPLGRVHDSRGSAGDR